MVSGGRICPSTPAIILPTAIASVPFCTPDSIEIVVASLRPSPIALAVAIPAPSIKTFRSIAIGPIVARLLEKTSQFATKAPKMMKTNSTTAVREIPGAILSMSAGYLAVSAIPSATGTAVIRNMVKPSLVVSTLGAVSSIK